MVIEKIKSFLIKTFYSLFIESRERKKNGEVAASWGTENPDKTFYVIRRHPNEEKAGLFSWIQVILGHLEYSMKKGWIPVVDMMNTANPFLEKDEVGLINAWEFFFEQPGGYTLSDIKKSKKVILSQYSPIPYGPFVHSILKKDRREKYNSLYKRYFVLKRSIQEQVTEYKEHYFSKSGNVLGVLCRGTDYWTLKPKGHRIQPDIEQIVEKLRVTLNNSKYKQIYLCTEDQSIYDTLMHEFGDKIITFKQDFVEYKDGYLSDALRNDSKTLRAQAIEYLIQMLLLAETDTLIAGMTSGTLGVLIFNIKFDNEFIWDLGYYK